MLLIPAIVAGILTCLVLGVVDLVALFIVIPTLERFRRKPRVHEQKKIIKLDTSGLI